MNKIGYVIGVLGGLLLSSIMLMLLWVMFAVLPVGLINEIDCLEAGYPKAYTTINLQGYCLNLDGSITGIVHKLSD